MWGLEPGNAFAGYLIDEFVGRGGMGVVFRAWQLGTDRAVALKVMSPELTGDEAYAALFKREARTAASIHHPHVIDVYDFGEVDGRLYLAMRLVEGRDLRKILAAEGALEPSRAAAMVAQAADALHAAHGRGLVHRDVKPANLLVTMRAGLEHIYLTDFGLTKHQRGTELAATRGMVGTLAYIAPEQARDDPVDARTDVYSLGAVLYHLVTGEQPYPRELLPLSFTRRSSRTPYGVRAARDGCSSLGARRLRYGCLPPVA